MKGGPGRRARRGAAPGLAPALAPALALLLAACAGAPIDTAPWRGTDPGWTPVAAQARRVGLGVPGGARLARGVRFAGGVEIDAPADSPLHSLSDLKIAGDDLVAVSDGGDLFRARLRLDRRGRLAGVDAWRMRPLTGDDGRRFPTKSDGDAEGLALTDDGRLLVAFEGRHRVRDYGPLQAPERTPRALPAPVMAPGNAGFEGLALAPGGWRLAAEGGGVWDCTTRGCTIVVAPPSAPTPDSEFRVTGLDRDPAGPGWFAVERRFRPPADIRGRLRRMDPAGRLGPVLVELSIPATVDNFEGVAAVGRPDGSTRLYILSDDNGSARQRTLLLAFDVPAPRPVPTP